MENRAHALAAGIFVIAMALAAVLAVWYFGGKREADTYLLETRGNVNGLNVQAQVRYRGIRAGKVESIDQDDADPRVILVKISLDPRFKLTKASTAQLGRQGITGLAYVDLEDSGGGSREALPQDDANPPRLPLEPGLADTLTERAGAIVAQIGELTARLNRLLDDKNVANLSRTLDNVAAASAGLKELPQAVAAMRAALSDENLRRLDAILAQLEKTAGEAAPLTAETRELVKSMTAASQKLDRLLGPGGEISAGTLPQVNALVRQLSANSNQLGRVLDMLEERPQSLIFGRGARQPGPGEAGFATPKEK